MFLLVEESKPQWIGLIDPKSIPAEEKTELYKKLEITGRYRFKYPGGEVCTGHKIAGSKGIEKLIAKVIEKGYYTLLWNSTEVHVIFRNKIFVLDNTSPWDQKEMDKLIKYGQKVGLKSMYFKWLRESMKDDANQHIYTKVKK